MRDMVSGAIGFTVLAGSVWCLVVLFGWWMERKAWNGGRCYRCGSPWTYIGTDSQGGRGYACRNHDLYMCGPWITYPWIDGR
jgi:hypothetical protein